MESRTSLISLLHDYFERIFQDIKNMKALILDEETTGIVSMIISQTEILQHDVFLVETIDTVLLADSEKLSHLSGVCILRPTEENVIKLQRLLSAPKYGNYYLYFTNVLPQLYLQKLAGSDKTECVKQVFEIFSDFFAINHDLFSLNLESIIGLTRPRERWSSNDQVTLSRMAEGLFAVCLALRRMPVLRFQRSSEVCAIVAERLHSLLRDDTDLLNSYSAHSGGRHKTTIDGVDQSTLLLIIDRREDPVTPLLHQWTYQAMLHELLGIKNNRVTLKLASSEDLKNTVLNCEQDSFYNENMYSNFGDLAVNINTYVEEYQKARQSTGTVDSIEGMKRFIEQFPEFKRLSGNVSKHVSLTYELDHAIKERMLLNVSEIEQDLTCNENRTEHFRMINEVLRDTRYNHFDKLKLVVLYALRYENDEKTALMKECLRQEGVQSEQIALIDAIISYAGANVRSCDLFLNKSLLAKAKSRIATVMKNVPNVYTQHQSYLFTLLESVSKGKLKETSFPATSAFNSKERLSTVIIFIVGGATYEEAKEVGMLNRNGDIQFILGGSCVHNSVSFLAEISQLILGVN